MLFRSLKSEFVGVLSVFITISPTHLLCEMLANSKGQYSSSETNKISSLLVNVPYKTQNQAFSRRSRARMAKKCAKKCAARAKLLFCFIKPVVF